MFKPGDYAVWLIDDTLRAHTKDLVFTTDLKGNPLDCSYHIWSRWDYKVAYPPVYEMITDIFRETNLVLKDGIVSFKGYTNIFRELKAT